jgi:hypothetical protein
MAGMLRVRRSRGALSGVLLVLLGVWGGLIPFVGPYVNYAYTPDSAWTYNSGRFWLEILPAIGVIVGGIILLASRLRPAALLGAWLAALSGCWFAVGGALAPIWNHGMSAGTPAGGSVARAVEQIGFFTGLGVVIVFVAALALGRLSVLTIKDAKIAERAAVPVATAPAAAVPAASVPAAAAPPAGQSAARTVLHKVFPAKAQQPQAATSEPPTIPGRRIGRHSAGDSGKAGTPEEVSSGSAQR